MDEFVVSGKKQVWTTVSWLEKAEAHKSEPSNEAYGIGQPAAMSS